MRALSDDLDRWFHGDGDRTVGGLIEVFGEKSFALAFVILMSPSALPLPTGGATNVFEVVVMVLALQLIAGRDEIWLPRRWRKVDLAGERRERSIQRLLSMVRRLERFARPRARAAFGNRAGNTIFGILVMLGTVAAFVAPPFSGLDTLPSLGVVVLSLGVLMEDALVAIAGIAVGIAGIVLEVLLATAVIEGLRELF